MNLKNQSHHLLVLSHDRDKYKELIEEAHLPGLSIWAEADPYYITHDLDQYDIVFGEPSLISKIIGNLSNLIWVQSSWAGVEPLLEPGLKRDFMLTNVRNVYGPLMSEYVFGYILLIERKMLERWQSQQARQWGAGQNGFLKGKLIGLLGVGSVGAHLASTAKQFGMRTYGYTRQSESCRYIDRYFHEGAWKEFACDLDYLVCSLPGTRFTYSLIDAAALSDLPEKAWLINVGRGSTVDDSALIQALNSRSIGGAVLDVFKDEPLPQDHPFWSTPNTFITFHTAAQNYPPDIASIFIENYKRLINGEPLNYIVDFELGY